ncbi:MAG: ABC transporter substrate-binding protein, partial [Burkholderiaceae bacterium]|nr:ABC transporter substrate-binding protein [Burkholderiaceae bacterium]
MTGHTLRWAVVALAALAAGCGDKPQQNGDNQVVRIGQVSPLTGPQAHLGKDNENGARLALEEINAAGLTLGG